MAFIRSVQVDKLAGRREPVMFTLDPYLNIFFGKNGTGKTGLLKLLHSALSLTLEPINTVAFERADVEMAVSKTVFQRRTIKNDEEVKALLADFVAQGREKYLDHLLRERNVRWHLSAIKAFDIPPGVAGEMLITRSGQKAAIPIDHCFLPITRLTTDLVRIRRVPGAEISDVELENAFGIFLQDRWRVYSNRVLSEVRRVQEDALARVLQVVLSPQGEDDAVTSEINTEQARMRVKNFLGRQAKHIPASAWTFDFDSEYNTNRTLYKVVNLIDEVEQQIEGILRTRNALQDLVGKMMENKQVLFEDDGIKVLLDDGTQIGIPRLSSGEKQLVRILVESLASRSGPIIIDEPELSMHVDWQETLLQAIRLMNPTAQIIVATHSPEIMANYQDENIFRL